MAAVTLSEVKVGLLVILAVMLVVVLTMSLGNFQSIFADSVTVSVRVPSVVGIELHAPVTYAGVRFGSVTKKRYDFENDTPVIELTLDYDSPVSMDSKVEFTSSGMLSPLFIEISGGTKEQRLSTLIEKGNLDPENIYIDGTPYASIGEFFALASDVKIVLAKVNDVLDGIQEPLGKASGIVDDLSGEVKVIASELREMLQEARPRFRNVLDKSGDLIASASGEVVPTLRNLREASGDVSPLVKNVGDKMDKALAQVNDLIDEISPDASATVREMRQLMQSVKTRIGEIQDKAATLLDDVDKAIVENRSEIDGMLANLKETSIHLNELSAQLNKDPWRVVWKSEGKQSPARVSPKWDPLPAPSK
ncbi:MAG: MlaD family protein [Candidatus Hinthialibacter antarcticus]|nr:MlaD family protein [Candidatus Hinthialibacter antarcticus]